MAGRTAALGICSILLSVGAPGSAAGQESGETAQINSGILQQQAGAERSLSAAIEQRMRASGDVLSAQRGAQGAAGRSASRPPVSYQPYTIPANIDPLAGTDAPTYRILGNGAVFRFSWSLSPSPNAVCIAFCP
jgi:hypothetical protein